MARFNVLDDGSTLVATDDGRQLRTAIPPDQLMQSFSLEHDPGLTLEQKQNSQVDDLTRRLAEIRSGKAPGSTPETQPEKPSNMGDLQRGVDQARAEDESRMTSELALQRPGAGLRQAKPGETLTDAMSPPVKLPATTFAPMPGAAAQGERVQFAPDNSGARGAPNMASYAGSQAQGAASNPNLDAIQQFAMQNAVKRTGPTKGGWVPKSQTVETSEVPPPEALQAVDAAERGEEQAAADAAANAAEGYRKQVVAPQLQALNQDLDALGQAHDRRKKYDAELARLRKVADDTEKRATDMKSVNARDDFFDNHGGVFGRLLAAVAMAGGAFASGYGMPNTAMQVVNSTIEDHSKMLRDKYERAKDAGKDARNAYGDALREFGDPESAMQALDMRGQALADRMVKLQADRHGNAQTVAAVDQWVEQRKVERAKRWADVAGKAAGRTVSQTVYSPGSPGGVTTDKKMLDLYLEAEKLKGAGTAGKEPWRQDAEARSRAVRLDPSDAERVGAPQGFAGSKEDAEKSRAALSANKKALSAIGRIKEIIATDNWEANPDLVAELEAQRPVLQATLASPLALRSQTTDELNKISGPLTGMAADKWTNPLQWNLDSQAVKTLNTAERLFQQDKESWLREMTRSPYDYDYIEPNVKTRPVR